MRDLHRLVVELQQPSSTEFVKHPDLRQISTFFLGWTFYSALHFLYHSPFVSSRLLPVLLRRHPHIVEVENAWEEKSQRWSEPQSTRSFTQGRSSIDLVFVLTLCIALASLAQFISLLAFNPNSGDTACAFVTAWSGMAGQSARILGLLKTSLDLRMMGVKLWESLVLWAWLSIGLIFIFATNAINIGTVEQVEVVPSLAFCYRRRLLPISLVASLIYIVTELYLIIRLAVLLAPTFLKMQHRLNALRDIRMVRVMSLFMLDILTIVPMAIIVNVAAESIPFALGSLLILLTFNYRPQVPASAPTNSIPRTYEESLAYVSSVRVDNFEAGDNTHDNTPRVTPQSSLRFTAGGGTATNAASSSVISIRRHPYSVQVPQDVSPPNTPEFSIQTIDPSELEGFRNGVRASDSQIARLSAISTDSVIAQSVKGAKISFAFRNAPSRSDKGASYSSRLPNNPRLAGISAKLRESTQLRHRATEQIPSPSLSPIRAESPTLPTYPQLKPPPLVLRKNAPVQMAGFASPTRSEPRPKSNSSITDTHNEHASSSGEGPMLESASDARNSMVDPLDARSGAHSSDTEHDGASTKLGAGRERPTTFGETRFSESELPPLPTQEIVVPRRIFDPNVTTRSPRSPSTPSTPRPKGPRPRT